ncbi:MAG: ATP-binding protein [Actinomycetes bacterium]|jgi:predicted AAA+ superfamily ATPase|nr:ATP-binding protein [Actinomycetes bacterium]
MIARPRYLNDLKQFQDKDLIKVLVGIRRCGKSSLLRLHRDQLLAQGVPDNRVIHLDFDIAEFSELQNAQQLNVWLTQHMREPGSYYVLLDEVQEIVGWEKVVNSLYAQKVADIYITGSNARVLSSELATYLTGRYVTVPVYPLSFEEYFAFNASHLIKDEADVRANRTLLAAAFEDYRERGGFPVVYAGDFDVEQGNRIVLDVYNSILLRDIVQRHNVRNVDMLERVAQFVLGNVGNIFSGNKIADYFKSQRRATNPETVYNYLKILAEAYVIAKASRFDIEGKNILKTNEKFFAGDHSLVTAVLGYSANRLPGVLENIVYLELRRRGWTTYVGKQGVREIDFVAQRAGQRIYVQVCSRLGSEETVQREFAPLRALRDSYPKYVISLDADAPESVEGIMRMSIPEFLLREDWA